MRDIWQARTRAAAVSAIDTFAEKYGTKSRRPSRAWARTATRCWAFVDFPAEHWDRLRMANPIESVFARFRHRTFRTKGRNRVADGLHPRPRRVEEMAPADTPNAPGSGRI